jgi:cyclase
MRRTRFMSAMLAVAAVIVMASSARAQDLGPRVKTLADGVYVHTGNGFDSNSGIILTDEGVVVIDTGQNPIESRDIMATVKKLTTLPVRLVIDTEPHADHTTGHFVFPDALVVAAAGGGESMRGAERAAPDRIQRLAATSPAMKTALEGYRFIAPHIEYHDKMTINFGGKTIELIYMKGVHSESDTAVWLPKERVVFSASAFVVNQINILRPFVTIPDILAAGKMMRALNPESVVPGHGTPGTVQIFDDGEKYYALLMQRVDALMKQGKSLDDIKKEVKMPEYASWGNQERMPTNVDAAYKALGGKIYDGQRALVSIHNREGHRVAQIGVGSGILAFLERLCVPDGRWTQPSVRARGGESANRKARANHSGPLHLQFRPPYQRSHRDKPRRGRHRFPEQRSHGKA